MEAYRVVNKVPTKVLTFGTGIGDNLLDVKHLVLVFPGNPGIIDYYREFMKELYVRLRNKYPKENIPVWGISHAGHQTEGSHEYTFPYLNENPEVYSLEGQCTHKVKFLESFVPPHINVIGIGHSIGCKIWMETLKRLDEHINSIAEPKKRPNISKVFMLFPTIERMRYTPNGQRTLPLLKWSKFLTPLLWPISLIPVCIQKWLVQFHFRGTPVPECAFPASLQLFNYDILKRIAFMAKCELEQVVELDSAAVEKYMGKLYFYFGTTDGWCPLTFVDEMKERFPKLEYKVCENGYVHAFVLENNIGMADFLCEQVTLAEDIISKDENGQI
ncbi:Lipid droplet-associated hydrolase [Orchesella cincta]|uniref:Lipid droplet-associated hydrolase n=1 Tax=Orchesella cincta TaxID=48709 RepID=A0A1D2MRI7_ORCCI|nr:Lipid droplet-associated hydrolase [Orchesella cincta]